MDISGAADGVYTIDEILSGVRKGNESRDGIRTMALRDGTWDDEIRTLALCMMAGDGRDSVQRNQGAGAKKQMADQKDEQKEELKWKRGNNCRWTESGFSTSLYYPQPAWTREHRKRLARRAKVGQKKK